MTQELEAMRKAIVIRNYATKTTSTYIAVLRKFLSRLEKPIESVTPDDIRDWQYFLVHTEKVSWSHETRWSVLCGSTFKKSEMSIGL